MKIIVGLGNPGKKYAATRHNIGFRVVEKLAEHWKADAPRAQFNAEVQKAQFNGEVILLMRPQTFMNLSGESVLAAIQFHKVALSDVVVVHDEMDLEPFTLRLKTGGGPGGHNGLKSMDQQLGESGYHRVRMGVGHPSRLGLPHDPADYVLGSFSKDEEKRLNPWIERACQAIEKILASGAPKAMTEFNREAKEE